MLLFPPNTNKQKSGFTNPLATLIKKSCATAESSCQSSLAVVVSLRIGHGSGRGRAATGPTGHARAAAAGSAKMGGRPTHEQGCGAGGGARGGRPARGGRAARRGGGSGSGGGEIV